MKHQSLVKAWFLTVGLFASSLATAAGICGFVPNDCDTQQMWASKLPAPVYLTTVTATNTISYTETQTNTGTATGTHVGLHTETHTGTQVNFGVGTGTSKAKQSVVADQPYFPTLRVFAEPNGLANVQEWWTATGDPVAFMRADGTLIVGGTLAYAGATGAGAELHNNHLLLNGNSFVQFGNGQTIGDNGAVGISLNAINGLSLMATGTTIPTGNLMLTTGSEILSAGNLTLVLGNIAVNAGCIGVGIACTSALHLGGAGVSLKLYDSSGGYTQGVHSEVGGLVTDWGDNYDTLGDTVSASDGAYMRMDLQTNHTTDRFTWHAIAATTRTDTPIAKMSKTGDLVLTGSVDATNTATASATSSVIVKTKSSGKIDISLLPVGTDSSSVAAGTDTRFGVSTSTLQVGPNLALASGTGTATSTQVAVSANPTISAPGLMPTASATSFMAATVTHLSGDLPTASATSFMAATVTHLSGDLPATDTANSRTPTGSMNATPPVQLAAGTSTMTATTVALASSPTVSINTGTATNQVIMGSDPRLVNGVTGSGVAQSVAVWTGAQSQGIGSLSDDGTNAWTSGKFTAGLSTTSKSSFASQPTTAARSDFTSAVGFTFTVSAPITVSKLGRLYVSGNAANHVVSLWISTNTSTPLAQATVLAASASDGNNFKWVSITPVALTTGHTYALAVDEVSGGDTWKDEYVPTLQSMIAVTASAYTATPSAYPSAPGTVGKMYDTGALWFPQPFSGQTGRVTAIGSTADSSAWACVADDSNGNLLSGTRNDGLSFAANTMNCSNGLACTGATNTATVTATNTGTSTSTSVGVRPLAASGVNISPVYGTTANTIMQGNDSRVTGALTGNAVTCSGTTKFNATNGQVTSCTSATYSDVGADASGAASAITSAGTAGYVARFMAAPYAGTLGNAAPYSATPTANSIPVADAGGSLAKWLDHVMNIASNYATSGHLASPGACAAVATNSITATATSGFVAITASITGTTNASGVSASCLIQVDVDGSVPGWGTGAFTTTYFSPSYSYPASATVNGFYSLSAGSHTITLSICTPAAVSYQCFSNPGTIAGHSGSMTTMQWGR